MGCGFWIGAIQQQVGDQIPRDQEHRRTHHHAQHQRKIARHDGFQEERAQARPAHQHFHQQRGAEQRAQREAEQADQRIERRRAGCAGRARRRRGMPCARAASANGASMASATLARMWRTSAGSIPITSTATGMIRWRKRSRNRSASIQRSGPG